DSQSQDSQAGKDSQQQKQAEQGDSQQQGEQSARDEKSAQPDGQQQQAQQQPSDEAHDPDQAAADGTGEEGAKPGDQHATANDSRGRRNEREPALERWLARISDDPGGLLREKLRREYAKRRYESR